jgi:hypothetical protein
VLVAHGDESALASAQGRTTLWVGAILMFPTAAQRGSVFRCCEKHHQNSRSGVF